MLVQLILYNSIYFNSDLVHIYIDMFQSYDMMT